MAEICIGTSGYDYPEWRGVLYPLELPRDRFLPFYAEHFQALEINYTYYGMPDESQLSAMVKRTNAKLKFSIKAHQSLTHSITVSTWRDSARQFRKALLPLENNNVLLSVLLQFPQSFHYDIDERRYLDNLVNEFTGIPLVTEFRHQSWQNKRVFDTLAERGIGWCVTDMPALRNLPAQLPVVTGQNAYFRFHGRNSGSWYGSNSRDRYDYLYTDAELESYVPIIESVAASAKVVQIYFNNHAKGQAVVNARRMQILADKFRK